MNHFRHRKRLAKTLSGAIAMAVFIGALTIGRTEAQSPDFDSGLQLYKAGQYGAAANRLLKAVKFPGKEAAAYYYLACCYYKLNRPADARAIYRTVVNNYPTEREAGLSAQMLQRLDPSFVPPAGIGGAAPATTSSAAAGASVAAATASSASKSGFPGEDFSKLPDEARIPFTTEGSGHMKVTVYLENRPIEAWFDTGASAHFGKNHLEAAGVPVPRGKPNAATGGWAGNPVPCWRQQMKVKLGNLTRYAPVTIEENMNLPPLVGQEFIQGYQCEVDNGSHYVILRKAAAFRPTSQQVSDLYDIPCVRRGMRDYVTMSINGKKLEVLIDTGAASSTFNEDDLKSIGIRVPDDAPTNTSQGVGGSFTTRTLFTEVRLGPIWKSNFPIHVGGAAGSAVGQDILSSQRFTIDRERNLMRFFH